MMSGKRGRKCSMKYCDSYQHTHKHLSFFRFPKDPERCKLWIEKAERPDLLEKVNVHEERVCQRHFDATMFMNEYKNRLYQSAVPMLCLTNEPQTLSDLMASDFPISMLNQNQLINMRKADFILKSQLAATNNLTITPSNGAKLHFPATTFSSPQPQEPLNLSKTSHNGSHSSSANGLAFINLCDSQDGFSPKVNRTSPSNVSSTTATITATTVGNNSKLLNIPNTGYKRPRQIFTQEQEEQLAVYVRDTSNYYSGLSSKEVRILAFVYGVCNQVEMPIGWRETHQASFDWCVGFIKRNKLSPTIITGISCKSGGNNTNGSGTNKQQLPKRPVLEHSSSLSNSLGDASRGNGVASGMGDINTSATIEID